MGSSSCSDLIGWVKDERTDTWVYDAQNDRWRKLPIFPNFSFFFAKRAEGFRRVEH